MPAEVTMPASEYLQLIENARTLQGQIDKLKEDLRLAHAHAGGDVIVALLRKTFGHALRVMQFAVGNLDPEAVRGWPHHDLRAVAEFLAEDPASSQEHRELAIAWKEFASVAADVEADRAVGRHKDREKQIRAGSHDRAPFPSVMPDLEALAAAQAATAAPASAPSEVTTTGVDATAGEKAS